MIPAARRDHRQDVGADPRHVAMPYGDGGAAQRGQSGTNGYDGERIGFQRLTPHRPAVVVSAVDAEDVRAAVAFAAARGLPVAVQATGHGLGRALQDGVLINTRRMSEVRVDPETRTARVAAGATWRQVVDAAAPYGLAPLSGSFPGVGAVSYTLGGGVGLLARRHGFAADHVRRIDVVTADGRLREVTASSDPDLFWALRGGGRGLGVVTGMEIDLLPVTRIFGGGLYFDVAEVPGVLEGWRRWTETVPEELTSGLARGHPDSRPNRAGSSAWPSPARSRRSRCAGCPARPRRHRG